MYTDSQNKKWFKGNLHTHTKRSDGRLTPEESAALYREHGYDFLSLTDHWKVSETCVHENGLLLLSGCEYNFGRMPQEGVFHVVAVGCEVDPGVKPEDGVQGAIDKIHAVGGIADLAHPCWSLNTVEQLKPLSGVDFTEIFNSVSDLPRNCRPYSGDVIDKMAVQGYYWKTAAVDDTHWYGEADSCRSFIYVKAEECTREALLAAIRAGDFYSSQGPRLSVERTEKGLRLTFPAEDHVAMATYFTDAVWTDRRSDEGVDMESAEFIWTGMETFVRVEVRDAEGRCAWTQVYPAKA